jgi:hypothetical protein
MYALGRALAFAGICLAVVPGLAPSAQAQATRTWVSGVGDDANPCSRTAPCKTFAGAISKTAANGEINIIDAGAFGIVTITKSITINGEGFEAGVLGSAANGITINAGPNDVVVLRGLDIDGSGGTSGAFGLNGIRILAAGAVHIQKCLIRNFKGASPNGFGILVAPGAAIKVYVSDTVITNNGLAGNPPTGGGIGLQTTAGGIATLVAHRVQVEDNANGIIVSSSAGNTMRAVVSDSVVAGSLGTGLGVIIPAGGPGSNMFVDQTTVVGNALGITASGSALVLVSNTNITVNGTGVSTANGGIVDSYGNNRLNNNAPDGSFTPPVLQQR